MNFRWWNIKVFGCGSYSWVVVVVDFVNGWQLIALWALGLPFIINGLCVMAVTSHCFCVTSRKSTQWCIHSHTDSNTPVSQTDLTTFSSFLLVLCGCFQGLSDVRRQREWRMLVQKLSTPCGGQTLCSKRQRFPHMKPSAARKTDKCRAEKEDVIWNDILIQIHWQRRN